MARAAEALDVAAGFGTVARARTRRWRRRGRCSRRPAIAPRPLQQRLPVRLRWTAVPGAARYRAELRAARRRRRSRRPLIDERVVTAPEASWADLADGAYRVVVRAIDGDGLEGADGGARLDVDARPEPPIAQAPALDAVLFGDRAAFAWTRPGAATGFDLEVSPAARRPARRRS